MNDSIGKIPKTKTVKEDLIEILKISEDKRSHVLYKDACEWLELKMKVVKIFAKRGLNKLNRKQ